MPGTISYVFASGGDPFSGRGRLNFPDAFVAVERDATNPLEVDVVINPGAGATLQIAYDGNERIDTTVARGPVEIHRGAAVAVTEAALLVAAHDAGSEAPIVEIWHDSATPAVADLLGTIRFRGNDGGGGNDIFADLQAEAVAVGAGAEGGALNLRAVTGGFLGRVLQIAGLGVAAAEQPVAFINYRAVGGASFFFYCTQNPGAATIFSVGYNGIASNAFGVLGDGTVFTVSPGTLARPAYSDVNDLDTGLVLPGGNVLRLSCGALNQLELSDPPVDLDTSILLRRNLVGVFSQVRVTMGAANSGGAGFRLLLVPN